MCGVCEWMLVTASCVNSELVITHVTHRQEQTAVTGSVPGQEPMQTHNKFFNFSLSLYVAGMKKPKYLCLVIYAHQPESTVGE